MSEDCFTTLSGKAQLVCVMTSASKDAIFRPCSWCTKKYRPACHYALFVCVWRNNDILYRLFNE